MDEELSMFGQFVHNVKAIFYLLWFGMIPKVDLTNHIQSCCLSLSFCSKQFSFSVGVLEIVSPSVEILWNLERIPSQNIIFWWNKLEHLKYVNKNLTRVETRKINLRDIGSSIQLNHQNKSKSPEFQMGNLWLVYVYGTEHVIKSASQI